MSLILATNWKWMASLDLHFNLSGQRTCLAHTDSGVHTSSCQPWPGRQGSHPINMAAKGKAALREENGGLAWVSRIHNTTFTEDLFGSNI